MSLAYSDAPFYWPLRGSIALQNGSGTPTFTRTTAKWVFDNEGKLITVPANAAAFSGARMVRNNIAGGISLWSQTNSSVASAVDPNGDNSAYTVTTLTSASNYVRYGFSLTSDVGPYRTHSIYFKPGSGVWYRFQIEGAAGVRVWFNAQTQTIGTTTSTGTGWDYVSSRIDPHPTVAGWYRLQLTGVVPVNSTTAYFHLSSQASDGSTSYTGTKDATIYLWHPQGENVTGQTDQTASEYVSGDQGAGVDGIKWFDTHKDGTPIAASSLLGLAANHAAVTNTMLYCRDFTKGAVGLSPTSKRWQISGTTGVEKLTNNSFDFGLTGWTVSAGAGDSITDNGNGSITFVASGSVSTTLRQDNIFTVGTAYVVTITIASGTGQLKLSQSAFEVANISSTVTFSFVADLAHFILSRVSGQAANLVISSISVKEAGVQPTLTQTGLDNTANSCSLLTATANDATILQTITAAASAGCTGFWVKRSVGTGTISITRDGGTNWTDITSLINSSTFTLVKIENTSVTNPEVGFKITTSGDAIIVDAGINHLGTILDGPIITTTVAVTVNSDSLTAPTSSNFSDLAGTIVATVTKDTWTTGNGSIVGSTTRGLYTSASNSGVQGIDGTNTVNGPTGAPILQRKIGIRYSGSSLQAFAGNNFGSVGSYDGSFNLTNISIASGARSGIKDIAIWQSSLTDSQITEINSNIADLVSSHTISYSNIDHYTITSGLVSMPNITSNIYNCQFRLGSVNTPTSINYNNINSIIYAGSLNITPSINNYFNNCQYRPANADSSINTSYNLINCIINTGRLDSISNIDSSIYNCQYRLSNANIIGTTTTNVLNNYKINTGFLITSNIVSSLVNKNIIYSIKLDAEYSVPVIQVNYLIN